MTRVISVCLPPLPTDRFRRQAGSTAPPVETPLILAGHDGRRRVVTAADHAAQQAGLRVGMPLAKAQALIRDLVIAEADPLGDSEALEQLALWMLRRFAPVVAADPPDCIVIDSTGADHLHGGEAALLQTLVARTAIADTWGAAHALARFGCEQIRISAPGQTAEDILPLPIAALRLPVATVDGLRVLGFERIGEVWRQPRGPLVLRLRARARPPPGRSGWAAGRSHRGPAAHGHPRSPARLRGADRGG